MTEPTYVEPTWTDVPSGTTPPPGALALSAADLTSLITHPIKAVTDRAVSSIRYDAAMGLNPSQQAIARSNIDAVPTSDSNGDPVARAAGARVNALTGWFHVDGYGADPTGVADSSTAILAAVADANTAGGRVYGHGTYKTTSEIVISHDNVELYGDVQGHMRINYTGSGSAVRSDNAAVRKACKLTNVHISCVTAGGTALKLDNAYRWTMTACKFESTAGTTGVAVDVVGSASKSTYYNTFIGCDAWGSLDCYRLGDNVNGTRWFGGVAEGPGRAVHMRAPTTNMGTSVAVGLAISCEGTNTSSEIVRIGDAGDTAQSSYNSFIGCRIESSGSTSIINAANSWYNVISGGSIAGTTTITDSVSTVGAGLTVMTPSAAINWHFGRPIDADSFTAGRGTATSLILQAGSLQAVGTNTDVNVGLRPKGAGGAQVGAFAGDGTGGLLAYTGGASPALRAQVGGTVCCDLFPAVSNYALRILKNGEANFRFRILDTGVLNWGDGTSVTDTTLDRKAAGVLGPNGPFRLQGYATGSLPSASTSGAGAITYDSTLQTAVVSDGTNWKQAAGSAPAGATKTASYNMVDADEVIISNGSSITISLPDPTTATAWKRRYVKNIHSTAATLNSQGTSKTIDGAASKSLAQWDAYTVVADGTQWLIV